jgi:uncharacterized protein YutE (UPF0331/DUF86 family)
MLHKRLLELIASHTDLLERIREKEIKWSNILELYAVLHTLQIHAQAVIDYLLHTCAVTGVPSETPIRCIEELKIRGMIRSEDAEFMKRIVRFRNILVHEYTSIDVERVKRAIETRGYIRALQIINELQKKLEESGLIDP